MNIDTSYIRSDGGFQLQSAPRHGYNLAPVSHNNPQPLPSAPHPFLVYDVLPNIPHQTAAATSAANSVLPNVAQARVQPINVPQPVAYTVPPAPARAAATSSACQPWVVVLSVVIVSLVIGGVAVAIVVTSNNNNDDDDNNNDCNSGEFYCSSGSSTHHGSCIPDSWHCDHIQDCHNGEDENNCQGQYCSNGDHYCNGLCINAYYVCDGDFDCYDGSDEYGCAPYSTPTPNHCDGYTCPDGYLIGNSDCIPSYWICDGYTDCVGGYDEQSCSGTWTTTEAASVSYCPFNETLCDGRCIPSYSICDGYPDCSNGEDETNCPTSCSSGQFYCSSGSGSWYYGYCIPDYWQCDDYQDCLGGEDENNCLAATCSSSQYTCPNGGIYGNCIPLTWECDGWVDCDGAPDEQNCNITCGPVEFTCESGGVFGQCIDASHQCDGYNHCTDGADEQNCNDTYVCPIPCSSSSLRIPKDKVCDGEEDCPGGAEEDRCLIMESGDTSVLKIFSVTTMEYHPFCYYGWTEEYSDIACAHAGFNSSRETRTKFGEYGIIVNVTSTTELFQSTPTQCPNNEIVEVSCIRNEVCGGTTKLLRVVGGENAEIEDHPWKVSIQEGSDYTGWYHFCGGTIISDRWVFSAAHCLSFIHESQYEAYRVLAGVERLSGNIEDVNSYSFETVIVHPLYDSYSLIMDFGLIKISSSFIESTTIQPACLPTPGQLFDDLTQVVIAGWGHTSEGGSTSDVLQTATVNFYNGTTCASTFTSLQHLICDGMVCAGLEEGGIDTCQGDSGGPLVAEISGAKYLVGVTSWGFGCARPNSPGVYAEVSYMRDWTNRELSKHQT